MNSPAPYCQRRLLRLGRGLRLAFALLAGAIGSSGAQAVTYANTATVFNWIDASTHTQVGYNTTPYKFNGGGGCGTTPPTLDDTLSDNIPIGFTFMYGGANFTQVRIMTNGRLQFNNNTTCGFGSPVTQLPYPNAGLDYTMRIYGNDLDPTAKSEVPGYNTVCLNRANCYISYATLGTAPNRSFVVTWSNVPEWAAGGSTSGNYNLQVILQENGEFIYRRPSCCASCRSARSSASAARSRCASTFACSPPRTATWPPRSPRGASARTCSIASTSSRSSYRPCVSGRATCCRWPNTCSACMAAGSGGAPG